MSRGFFALFGGRPVVGRLLVEDDFAAANSVVLSHATWQRVFVSDRDIVGGTIRIGGEAVTVVGVLEQGFEPPQALVASSVDVWKPIDWSREDFDEVGYHILDVAGRMSPGATEADVQAELDALAARMAVL